MELDVAREAQGAQKTPLMAWARVLTMMLCGVWWVRAEPRNPLPPIPESGKVSYYESFDAPYRFAATNPPAVVTSAGVLTQSWSGYALVRSGAAVVPAVVPALDLAGHTNISCGLGGAVRFWVQPRWPSSTLLNGGGGPGKCARLLDLVAVSGGQSASVWSLQATADGSALRLAAQTDDGPVELLRAAIEWEAETPHCIVLDYSSRETVLFIDGQQAASGYGAPALPPAAAALVIGSGMDGADTAECDFDEFYSFAFPMGWSDVAFYYSALAGQAALGPVSAAEKAAWRLRAAAIRQASAMLSQENVVLLDNSESSPPCGDGGPVYLTNTCATDLTTTNCTVTFQVAGGSNGAAYCLYSATNLVPALTNSAWRWRQFVYACDTVVLTNQPVGGVFYMAGPEKDTDGDGMPDWWEMLHGLNPLDAADATDDPDGDGFANYQEYINGSNPHDVMVVAWGENAAGQCDVPEGLRDAAAVAAGADFSLALRPDGTVVAWGGNACGQTNIPAAVSNAMILSANWYDAAVVRSNGTAVHWGASTASDLSGAAGLAGLSVGYDSVLGLRADGTAGAWGQPTWRTEIPNGLSNVTALAAGANHCVAVLADGSLRAWGKGVTNLGWNLTNAPAGLTDGASVAAGMLHSLVLRRNGTVLAWGNNGDGQTTVPPGLSNVVAVAAGLSSSLALQADGSLRAWGSFGPGGPAVIPSGLNNVLAVAAGQRHFLAVRGGRLSPVIIRQPEDQVPGPGRATAFSVRAAALAPPQYQWQFSPATSGTLTNWTMINGATTSTLALANCQLADEGSYRVIVSNGAGSITSAPALLTLAGPPVILYPTNTVNLWVRSNPVPSLEVRAAGGGNGAYAFRYYWQHDGTNAPGAVDSSSIYSLTPLPSLPLGCYTVTVSNCLGTATSKPWVVRWMTEGAALGWGCNYQGELDVPAGETNVIALAAGHAHSVALREDGTVFAWGDTNENKTLVPASATNVTAIACGNQHSIALRADGTVVAWGRDEVGETAVPGDLTNAVAIAAGGLHNLAMTATGELRMWGMDVGAAPAGLTNVTAIAAGIDFNLALKADGTVVAWGDDYAGQTDVPADLTNVVAIAAGDFHGLALRQNGTVVAWGYNWGGQVDVPEGLTNVMAVAAGSLFSMALRNDGTVAVWGDNTLGQTNVFPGLSGVKTIAAGGAHALAALFSPWLQYPVDVTKDLLLIYNTNSADSTFVKDYYLAHRPMVSGANVLGIGCTTNETILPEDYTNVFAAQVQGWLTRNPTRRPQYVVLFLDLPSRVNMNDTPGYYAFDPFEPPGPPHPQRESVQYQLHTWCWPEWHPFVTCINMNGTNDCRAYVDKIESTGRTYSPGRLLIVASARGHSNITYVVDSVRNIYPNLGEYVSSATNGLLDAGIPTNAILYLDGYETTNALPHITTAADLAGYICWGAHSSLGGNYAIDGTIRWTDRSDWWIMETIESFNGQRSGSQGTIVKWFSATAFGGTNYSNTPVAVVSHVDEPGLGGVNNARTYFGLWASGKNFGICAWNSPNTVYFQAVGDPLVTK